MGKYEGFRQFSSPQYRRTNAGQLSRIATLGKTGKVVQGWAYE
jgi:hypothetical protein